MNASLESLDRFCALGAKKTVPLVRSGARAPASLAERCRILLMLGRPRTCVPGMLCYVLGVGYTTATPSARMVAMACLCFLGGFVANLGNTYTDLEEDARNLPGRLYLIAKLGFRSLGIAVIVLNVCMLLAAAVLGTQCFVAMIVSLLLVHEYSFGPVRAKRRPILGLFVFAQVVAFPLWIASLTEPGAPSFHVTLEWIGGGQLAPSVELDVKRFLMMLAFVSLWFFAKGVLKNVPDYDGDRAAGLRTSATLFPTRRHAAVASLALTIAAYSFLAVPVLLGFERRELLATLVWLIPVAWNGVRLVRAEDRGRANQCMKVDMLLSSGFIALLVAMNAPTWASVPAIAVSVFVLLGSDLLQLDSRRPIDVAPGKLVRTPGSP